MRRRVIACVVTVAVIVGISAALVPVRSDLSIATVGLILVVPVVASVVVGGYLAGVVAVAFGFLAWDFVFIPPYYTLSVGAAQNWVALAVYAVVMLLVARLVHRLQVARVVAQDRAAEAQRLFEVSQLLVGDRSLPELLATVVGAVRAVFGASGVALLLPRDGELEVGAAAGEALEVTGLEAHRRSDPPVVIGTVAGSTAPVRTVALAAAGRPVGVLALSGGPRGRADSELLQTFANHAALAVERAQLQAQALRAQILEEVETLRRALLGSVSHDLRTPLATMKVATSTLIGNLEAASGSDDARELCELLDSEIDHLTRLVTGLLDLSRYQAGLLKLGAEPRSVLDLVTSAVVSMRPTLGERTVNVAVPDDLPPVHVDAVLAEQVIVNLIDNAHRHAPPATAVEIHAGLLESEVELSVSDRGAGFPLAEREQIFDGVVREGGAGRSGIGLWICRAFVEAHGGRIWVDPAYPNGTRINFTLPGLQSGQSLPKAG